MKDQKTLSKQYKFLNGSYMKCYIGRIPSIYKHTEYELSPFLKSNRYGEYEDITIRVNRTHFNGKNIRFENDYVSVGGAVRNKLVVSEQDLILGKINLYKEWYG